MSSQWGDKLLYDTYSGMVINRTKFDAHTSNSLQGVEAYARSYLRTNITLLFNYKQCFKEKGFYC